MPRLAARRSDDARPFKDALELLEAMVCYLGDDGALTWQNDEILIGFGNAPLPNTLQELETRLGLGRVTPGNGALERNLLIAKNDDFELRCNLETRLVTVQKLRKFGAIDYSNDPQTIALAKALDENRVCLYRQPIVAANDFNIVRYECLARMIREDGSIAAPYEFIPAAERSGLISYLDIASLNLALEALKREDGLRLAVNVSPATIADNNARQEFESILRASSLEANNLTIEITETMAIQDLDIASNFVTNLRVANARVALDDFGAGFTSFRALKSLALNELKIDGHFVEKIHERGDSRAFVEAIDVLSRELGLETIAERVETEAEAKMLCKIGVNGLQGYLYGKPVAV